MLQHSHTKGYFKNSVTFKIGSVPNYFYSNKFYLYKWVILIQSILNNLNKLYLKNINKLRLIWMELTKNTRVLAWRHGPPVSWGTRRRTTPRRACPPRETSQHASLDYLSTDAGIVSNQTFINSLLICATCNSLSGFIIILLLTILK